MYVLFGKMSIHFCSFLNQIVLLNAELFIYGMIFFLSSFDFLIHLYFILAHGVSGPFLPAVLRCLLSPVLQSYTRPEHMRPESIWTFWNCGLVQSVSFLVSHCFNNRCIIICFNICQENLSLCSSSFSEFSWLSF